MTAVQGVRRRARAFALQVLYALDLNETGAADPESDEYSKLLEVEVEGESLAFAQLLVGATREHLNTIDETIQAASKNWRVERMSRVDRNILRLATYELCHAPDVPKRVIINEAIELAKRFGTNESAAFVNGILDRVGHKVRQTE